MRKCIAGFLLCALVLQGSAGAAARTEQTDSVLMVNGVASTAAAQIAADFVSNMSVLAAIVRPVSASGQGARVPYNLGPITPPKPMSVADMRKNFHPRSGAPTHDNGIPVKGPAMLARPLLPTTAKKLRAPQNSTIPGATRRIQSLSRATVRTTSAVNLSSTNLTGMNPYWVYSEGAVTGIGKYMLNVGNGNLLVQADDVDIPERGIDLAFRRTYNSLSQYDWNQTDGSENPGQYGAGWTNSLDSHLANNSAGGLSVFDLDGARYDYTPNGTGCYTPPPGQHASLCFDGGAGYFWTKKSGTVYYFYAPWYSQGSTVHGYSGRLYRIYGRNNNNYIQFTYSWVNGNSSAADYLTQIVAQHTDGQTLTLYFETNATNSAQNPTVQRLLTSIVRPDGVSIPYYYDSSGYLLYVMEPSNAPGTNPWQGYAYYGGHLLQWAASPRWISNNWSAVGGYTNFAFNASNQLSQVAYCGVANPTPDDGTSTPIQNGSPINVPLCVNDGVHPLSYWWSTTNFSYDPGTTYLRDADGHATNWWHDTLGRVTETDEYPNYSYALSTLQGWDSNNNLLWARDARGNQTDYAYDSNGDTIAVAAPAVNGFRPTTLLSYDNFFNVVSACDPASNHNAGRDWSGSGTPASCPSANGSTYYGYDYSDSYEPNGKLTDTHSPLGYHSHIAYDSGAQGGDFGLPSSVIGDGFTQMDGTSLTPTKSFAYDSRGDLSSYNAGAGNVTQLQYDTLNQATLRTDADGVSMRTQYFSNGQTQCTDTAAQYALDGNVVCGAHSDSYAYDADGNVTGETHHYGDNPGTIQKWYDGADRLIEVVEPTYDPNAPQEVQLWPWLTRYIYDLSQGAQVSIQYGSPFSAHGNLYKTERYLPGATVTLLNAGTAGFTTSARTRRNSSAKQVGSSAPRDNVQGVSSRPGLVRLAKNSAIIRISPRSGKLRSRSDSIRMTSSVPPGAWMDVSASGFDALDRKVADYRYAPGSNTVETSSYTFDAGTPGLLASKSNPVGDTTTFAYDALGHTSNVGFVVSNMSTFTAPRSYTYDADGRVASVGNTEFGTWQYAFDGDGRLSTLMEGAGGSGIPAFPYASGSVTSHSTFQYAYYPDGSPSAVQIAGPYPSYVQYSYRADGAPSTTSYQMGGTVSSQHTAAGRLTSHADPAGTETISYDSMGRTASDTVPSGSFTNFQYDAEGEPTQYTVTPLGVTGTTVHNYYTATGELASNYSAIDPMGSYLFDGVPVPSSSFAAGPDSQNYSRNPIVDTRNLLVIGNAYEDSAGNIVDTEPWSFDAAGRLAYEQNADYITDGQSWFWYPSYGPAYGYDAEDHTTSVSSSSYYAWGPLGHPVSVATLRNNVWHANYLHWTGDALSFSTRGDGSVDNYKLGGDGDVFPGDASNGGPVFYGRDPSGRVLTSHYAAGHTGFSDANGQYEYSQTAQFGASQGSGPSFWDPSAGPAVTYARPDGITDGFSTIQGVRNYNPDTQQWTTPDAYTGDIEDPMSQNAYTWNRNNPLSYSDPTGFSSDDACAKAVSQCLQIGSVKATHGPDPFPILTAMAGALADSRGNVTLYRAVEEPEYQDILKHGGFRLGRDHAPKGFFRNINEVMRTLRYISRLYGVPLRVIRASTPLSNLKEPFRQFGEGDAHFYKGGDTMPQPTGVTEPITAGDPLEVPIIEPFVPL